MTSLDRMTDGQLKELEAEYKCICDRDVDISGASAIEGINGAAREERQ